MLTPENDRWQMKLVNSVQAEGYLVGRDKVDELGRHRGEGCCLGIALMANGFARDELAPGTYDDRHHYTMPANLWNDSNGVNYGYMKERVNRALPLDDTILNVLASMNDNGVPHRVIREMLMDFWMTGDPSEFQAWDRENLQ